MTELMTEYYEHRAPHFDAIYERPERQTDLSQLKNLIPAALADQDVLEIAAGTGYWTQFIATTARSVVATDVNPAPLAIAQSRVYPRSNVELRQADAFALDVTGTFTAAFAGFWWSHLRRADTDAFLDGLCQRLESSATVVLVDNRYVEGSSQPIMRTDAAGNTYQRRRLADGTTYEIVKNFPGGDELLGLAGRHGLRADLVELEFYWLLILRS